jgi:hypothetical protein
MLRTEREICAAQQKEARQKEEQKHERGRAKRKLARLPLCSQKANSACWRSEAREEQRTRTSKAAVHRGPMYLMISRIEFCALCAHILIVCAGAVPISISQKFQDKLG